MYAWLAAQPAPSSVQVAAESLPLSAQGRASQLSGQPIHNISCGTLGSNETHGLQTSSNPPSSTNENETGGRARYPARNSRAACPICGKHFFNLMAHAATCQLEDIVSHAAPQITNAAQDASNKKRRPKSVAGAALDDKRPIVPQIKKKSRVTLDGPSSYFQGNHLPPPLGPSPPEDEGNKEIAKRECALLVAAANAASQNPTGRHIQADLLEIEPGVTMLVSDTPFCDGQGQGMAFTLRNDIRRMIDELTALRENDSIIRNENEKLRKLVQELQQKAHDEITEKFSQFTAERGTLEEAFGRSQNELTKARSDIKRLESDVASANSQLSSLKADFERVESELKRVVDEVNATRVEKELVEARLAKLTDERALIEQQLADAEARATHFAQESASAKSELALKQEEIDDLERELETLRAEKPNLLDEDPLREYDLQSSDELEFQKDIEEYIDLLQQWLVTHDMSIKVAAIAIFHGTKPRANVLWQKISPRTSFSDIIHQYGLSRGIVLSSDQETLALFQSQELGHPSSAPMDDLNSLLLSEDLLHGISLETNVRQISAEESLVERVVAWLEEKGGLGSWTEFQETFPSYMGTPEELSARSASQFFSIDDGSLVLNANAETVLVSFFCDYLKKGYNGVAPASRFHHFLETTPGALRIRDRLQDSKLGSLASKYPDRLHFWRGDDGAAFCCLKEELPRIEREKAERKRQAEIEKNELDRKRAEQEMLEAEARARNEWMSQKSNAGNNTTPENRQQFALQQGSDQQQVMKVQAKPSLQPQYHQPQTSFQPQVTAPVQQRQMAHPMPPPIPQPPPLPDTSVPVRKSSRWSQETPAQVGAQIVQPSPQAPIPGGQHFVPPSSAPPNPQFIHRPQPVQHLVPGQSIQHFAPRPPHFGPPGQQPSQPPPLPSYAYPQPQPVPGSTYAPRPPMAIQPLIPSQNGAGNVSHPQPSPPSLLQYTRQG